MVIIKGVEDAASLLAKGLVELQLKTVEHQATVLNGEQCTRDGYRPRGWQPFSQLNWLGDWLRKHNPQKPCTSQHTVSELIRKPYHELSRTDKALILYYYSNQQHFGLMHADVAYTILSTFQPALDTEAYNQLLAGRINDPNDVLDVHEFIEVLLLLAESIPDEVFELHMQESLACWNVSYCSSVDAKLECVFSHLDEDHSGFLTLSEIAQLAKTLCPTATEAQLAASLAYLDIDSSDGVGIEEFIAMLRPIVETYPDERAIDEKLQIMLNTAASVESINKADIAWEVYPTALAKLTRSVASYGAAPQYPASLLISQLQQNGSLLLPSSIMLVDVRTKSEQEVSVIPFSICMELAPSGGQGNSYTIKDHAQLMKLQELWEAKVQDWHGTIQCTNNLRPASRQEALGELMETGSTFHDNSRPSSSRGTSRPSSRADKLRLSGQGSQSSTPEGHMKNELYPPASQMCLITYDSYGEKGGAAALMLKEILPDAPIYNLCGGILNYYNNHGIVVDATGQVVSALHPGSNVMMPYITRVNTIKF